MEFHIHRPHLRNGIRLLGFEPQVYPFVGLEWLMVIIALVFWIGWHIAQFRMENRQHDADAARLRQGRNLVEAVETERIIERF